MEIETSTNETIPDVNTSPEKATEEVIEKEAASPSKEVPDADKPKAEKRPIEAPKNNGTTTTPTTTPVKKPLSGIVVQFPEMFSLKRDAHFLEKLEGATDIKLQKLGYIECESEEVAAALKEKLASFELSGKKVTATRLNLTEKKILYCNGIRKEDTDEILKTAYPEIQEIKRESYNTFVLFSSETEARAARQLIQKDGVNGHKIICEFDNSGKDRFSKPEEPAAKKAKVEKAEEPAEKKEEGEEEKKEEEAEEESKMETEAEAVKEDEDDDEEDDDEEDKADDE